MYSKKPEARASMHHLFAAIVLVVVGALPGRAGADFSTGVSDDRVSLPEGPGSLEGVGENVSIDANMATMRWSIPIDVPDGFDGVTPMLALNYSSGAGNSVAGIGWTFDVPYVERMTSRGLPEYDETDLFSSSGGDELVRITGDSAGASIPAVYRSRFEKDFTRFSWIARDDGRNGFWKAEYADGSVGFFGADKDGVSVGAARVSGDEGTFRYHLVDKIDVDGHRLHYTWRKDGNDALLTTAEWIFNSAGVARYRVTVDYEDRDDLQSDCKPGFEDVLSERITAINVFSKNQRIRRYVLGYDDYDVAGGQSRLARVETRGQNGELYPIVQSFTYSRSLGVNCNATSCGQPTIVPMGTVVGLAQGKATLVDMNGDALPDVVDTDVAGGAAHRFFFNQLASSGAQSFSAAVQSQVGLSAAFALGTRPVQVLDQDGDGFTDIVNSATGRVLRGRGLGEWARIDDLGAGFPTIAPDTELRFMDIDNDKRIDLVRSEAQTTNVNRANEDGGFDNYNVDALGISFADNNVSLTDMNGDGLLDVVRSRLGEISYRLSYGRGHWGPERSISVALSDVEDDISTLEDMNGDGLADIVIVSGTSVKYMLNRNGDRFDAPVFVTTALGGSIPERDGQTTVLYADMNGNGSTDIVWVEGTGRTTYLDVFPVRQHLLSRIENGIGRVTDISYTTSALESAAARESGRPWAYQVPFPNTVVKIVDETDRLTNVHDVAEYRYFDGFYDGVERVYRGYENVELSQEGDEHQEGSLTATRYDVGVDDAHRAGLKLREDLDGEDREIHSQTWSYALCAVAEVPAEAALIALGRKPVRRFCEVSSSTIVKEGRPEAEWLTTKTDTEQDGYGNTIETIEQGIVDVTGDERYRTWSFVTPDNTEGRWLLGAGFKETMSTLPGPARGTERVTYYDGAPFIGLAEGRLTKGNITRISERVSDSAIEDVERNRLNADGQPVERYDALGIVGQHEHRETWSYDADSLLVTESAKHLNDAAGAPYSLVRRYAHEDAFDKPVQATSWIRVVDGEDVSPRNDMFFAYDGFGRLVTRVRPGDTLEAPTETFAYELGDPTTRIVTRRRTSATSGFDLEEVGCMDGRGRTFQKRTKVNATTWQVDGFVLFNLRGEKLRISQPYTSTSGACDTAPPAGVAAVEYAFDAVNRSTRVVQADGSVFSTTRTPFAEAVSDPSDLEAGSDAFNTPIVVRRDGLDRVTRIERVRAGGEAAAFTLRYDNQSRLAGYTDPLGNEKRQRFDLRGRVVEVEDPNAGTTRFEYDVAGNLVKKVDGSGAVLRAAYDGANRLLDRWNEIDRDGTLAHASYDVDSTCGAALCTNTAGKLASFTWPEGGERFGYDGRGNTLVTSRRIEDITYETRFTYDAADRQTKVVHPDGRAIDTSLDGAGRAISIAGIVAGIDWDERGLLQRLRFENGVEDNRIYDEQMRLTGIKAGSDDDDIVDVDYSHDGVGNVIRVEDALDVAGFSFDAENRYDEWHRLVSSALGTGADSETQAFTYDVIENLLSSTSTKAGSLAQLGAYEYEGAGPSAVTKVGTRGYSYDDAGQLTKRGDVELTWDHMGRLTSARENGVETGRYLYGAAAERVAKIEKSGVVHYVSPDFEVRDGIGVLYVRVQNQRVARLESKAISSRALIALAPKGAADDEINAGDAWVAHTVDDAGDAGRLLLAAARRLLHDDGPKTAFLHRDLLGSAVVATDADGDVVGRQTFNAFGEQRASTGFVDAYAFSGQELDAATGLTHFKHRSLDTSAGRWVSTDPLFLVADVTDGEKVDQLASAYGYAANNPSSNVDPDGLDAGAAAGGAAAKAPSMPGTTIKNALNKVKAGMAKFAKAHPKIATAIRVGLIVTGAALAIAGSVATGGALGVFIGGLALGSAALKVATVAKDYTDLKAGGARADAAGERFAKGVVGDVLGVVSGSLGVAGVTAPATAAGAALSAMLSAAGAKAAAVKEGRSR